MDGCLSVTRILKRTKIIMNEEIIPTDKKIKVTRDKINQKTIDRLNRMHEEVMSSAVEVAKKAIALGEELLAAKKLVKYGTWEIWVEENLLTIFVLPSVI